MSCRGKTSRPEHRASVSVASRKYEGCIQDSGEAVSVVWMGSGVGRGTHHESVEGEQQRK